MLLSEKLNNKNPKFKDVIGKAVVNAMKAFDIKDL